MGFVSDKLKGEVAENAVADILSSHWNVQRASDLKSGAFYDWDLSVSQVDAGCEAFTVEVKYDEMQHLTGNLAIEFYNCKSNKPSGLSATKADLWCHVLKESTWMTSVKKLKDFCENKKPFRTITGGGDGNASIFLYKTKDIIKIFERVDNCSKEQLMKKIESLLK
tara:strand:+ start:1145 stop:1642 length:498 start_codon:yes stop_codon:yes gene_type:complete